MEKIQQTEINEYVTSQDSRTKVKEEAEKAAEDRFFEVGGAFNIQFETWTIVRYLVLEKILNDKIEGDDAIQELVEKYSKFDSGTGRLCAMLTINESVANKKELIARCYLKINTGEYEYAQYEGPAEDLGDGYMVAFGVGEFNPIAIGCDHPDHSVEIPVTLSQQTILRADAA